MGHCLGQVHTPSNISLRQPAQSTFQLLLNRHPARFRSESHKQLQRSNFRPVNSLCQAPESLVRTSETVCPTDPLIKRFQRTAESSISTRDRSIFCQLNLTPVRPYTKPIEYHYKTTPGPTVRPTWCAEAIIAGRRRRAQKGTMPWSGGFWRRVNATFVYGPKTPISRS